MDRGGGDAVGVAWLGERFEARLQDESGKEGGKRMFTVFLFLFLFL